jgi:hypothetical protein
MIHSDIELIITIQKKKLNPNPKKKKVYPGKKRKNFPVL